MKRLLIAVILISSVAYADNCSDYKSKAVKYEKMGISASNLDIGAKYLRMSIKNKKETLNTCFYSGLDKEKIYKEIKEMESMADDMNREATQKRQHDLDVARERSNINVRYK